ncbi:MAG: hypothetical protein EBS41_02390 [Actinobacteria bacterium]|nr:hypothetical protein [Actinomycetota bacterium]
MTTRVLLVTTNGTGMGHLARMTAVALAGKRTGEIEPFILTMSVAAPMAAQMGIPVEYCPSTQRGWHAHWEWDAYLRERLALLIEHLNIDVVMFDGVMPYDGLLAVMPQFPRVRFVWCRRGMWRRDAKVARRALARARFFDAVIEPGDLASSADNGRTAKAVNVIRTSSVSLTADVDMLPRDAARAELGLDASGRYVFFAFGSGLTGDSATVLRALVSAATLHRSTNAVSGSPWQAWQVATVKPWRDAQAAAGVLYIDRVFPLVRYLRAFDAVVTSAGYNAVHEFVSAGMPCVVVPNSASVTDDQEARAGQLQLQGLALTSSASAEPLNHAFSALLDGWVPTNTAPACNGSAEIATVLATLAARTDSPELSGAAVGEMSRQQSRIDTKLALMRLVGPVLISALRRLRGRRSAAIAVNAVVITDDLAQVAAHPADAAIEHLITTNHSLTSGPSTAVAYERARRELVRKVYSSRL